jgi:DNA-binding transcriptional ArsR family regulator
MFDSHRNIRNSSNSTTVVELAATLIYARLVSEEVFHPAVEELTLPKVLAALADPARLATVQTLARVGESACGQIQHDAGLVVSKSTMSHHLRILREAGITYSRVQGARRMLTLRREDLDARFPGLLDAVLHSELAETG